ncbi:sirohydrochlorin chelatase [Nocardioides hankookensis]|uniref:Sirohydrochlorin chelatase n=1 Tax=Nocardioides hankookensis TaxID=443157 RepID=A0ABW1LFR3_9ACTN
MRLVTVAHGTRSPEGNAVARDITGAAGTRLGMPWIASYVELCTPLFSSLSDQPSVLVPLLLSTGHHVRHDLRGARALGPDPLLAVAQAARLEAAGARPGQPVVMVAAGSRDPLATRDQVLAAAYLSEHWGGPVRLATLSGVGRRPVEVVTPDDAVSPYLLAPGHFASRARSESSAAAVVADVIGAHAAVVDLVVSRTVEALADLRSA